MTDTYAFCDKRTVLPHRIEWKVPSLYHTRKVTKRGFAIICGECARQAPEGPHGSQVP